MKMQKEKHDKEMTVLNLTIKKLELECYELEQRLGVTVQPVDIVSSD